MKLPLINYDAPLRIKDGEEAFFVAMDGPDRYICRKAKGTYCAFDKYGRYTAADGRTSHVYTLTNAPVKHERWMIVYRDSIDEVHPAKLFHSEAEARRWAGSGLLAIKKVSIAEGEGL